MTVTDEYLSNKCDLRRDVHRSAAHAAEQARRGVGLHGRTIGRVIHHTDCGMLTFTDDEFKKAIQDETGIKPEWAAESFTDPEEDIRQSLRRIEASPFVTKHVSLRGFVFDVATGRLNEVTR